jgi:hypothetical protein
MGDNMSPADVAAVVDNNRGYPYPMYGGNNGFGGTNSDWVWIILLLALFGGFGGNGFGFGGGFNNDYAWLSNGQKEIMQNTNDGFNTLQLANQLTGINSGVQNLSTQLCNCCADVNSNLCNGFAGVNATVNSGFANAEQSANARQMANMQQAFSNQLSTVQGFNSVNSALCDASAENRLGQANLTSTILAENCADRQALSEGVRDIITNQTSNTQRILDQMCNDKIDAKNEKIADLQRQLQMADLKASQIEQNAFIAQGFANEVDQLYNRLNNCPVPSTPVYGRTPIFTCNNNGCGCGCNGI